MMSEHLFDRGGLRILTYNAEDTLLMYAEKPPRTNKEELERCGITTYLELEEEYKLIMQKKSTKSKHQRDFIIYFYNLKK